MIKNKASLPKAVGAFFILEKHIVSKNGRFYNEKHIGSKSGRFYNEKHIGSKSGRFYNAICIHEEKEVAITHQDITGNPEKEELAISIQGITGHPE